MCSDLRAKNTSRAAAFNTDCSRRSWVSDTPALFALICYADEDVVVAATTTSKQQQQI